MLSLSGLFLLRKDKNLLPQDIKGNLFEQLLDPTNASKTVKLRDGTTVNYGDLGQEISDMMPNVKNLSDKEIQVIKNSFLKYPALVFRNQALKDDDLIKFGKIFGELEQHLIENSDGKVMTPVHQITNFDSSGKPSSRPYINTNYFTFSGGLICFAFCMGFRARDPSKIVAAVEMFRNQWLKVDLEPSRPIS